MEAVHWLVLFGVESIGRTEKIKRMKRIKINNKSQFVVDFHIKLDNRNYIAERFSLNESPSAYFIFKEVEK